MAHQIDLEFQPSLQRVLVQNINNRTTTVDEALSKFSEQVDNEHNLRAGTVKTSIKRAVPYRPVFSDRLTTGQISHVTVTVAMLSSDIL
jgi:hypothetical protein